METDGPSAQDTSLTSALLQTSESSLLIMVNVQLLASDVTPKLLPQ
jgi:hypothetical protein